MKIVIVGAGIVGSATAHALLEEGHEVTILDAHHPAYGPSQGNAGWIAHTDILPLASPKSLKNLPRYFLDPLGPLAIRPEYALKIAPWLLRFLAASRPSELERSTAALTALQQMALPSWLALAQRIGIAGMIHRRGGLYLHDNEADFQAAAQVAERQRAAGFTVAMIREDEVRRLEPAIKPGHFVGGAYVEDTAHISDPRDLTNAVFKAALERGARYEQRKVELIHPADRPVLVGTGGWQMIADKVVLSAGIWSKQLAMALGDTLPLDTERGYNVSFPGVTGLTSRPIAFEGHGFIANSLDSGLRIGGAVEFGGLKLPPNHKRTRALHAKAQRFLDGVPDYDTGTEWMGFRPSLPDSLPVIGLSSRSPHVAYAFGHGHYGMTQSVATGKLVADLFAGRAPAIDLTAFSGQRY